MFRADVPPRIPATPARSWAVGLVAWAAFVPSLAHAAPSPVSRLRPAASVGGHVTTESSQVLPKWTPSAALLTTYDRTFNDAAASIRIDRRIASHVLLGFGIAGWGQIDLDLPLTLHQRGQSIEDDALVDLRPAAVGDLRVGVKGTALRTPRRGFGLGFGFDVTAPTGDPLALSGYGGVSFLPALLLEYRARRGVLLDVNLGYLARPEANLNGFIAGDGVVVRGAVRVPIAPREQVAIFSEVDALPSLVRGGGSPIALRGGLRWQASSGIVLSGFTGGAPLPALGTGQIQFGLSVGYAPPKAMRTERAFAGAARPSATEVAHRYDARLYGDRSEAPAAVDPTDPDGDGVLARADLCPGVAEDRDGFEDTDGCPELDNDHDGLRDGVDLCPSVPEVVNGALDADGCPDEILASGAVETRETLNLDAILPRVQFEGTSAALDEHGTEQLRRLAARVHLNPWINRIRLRVYVEESGVPAADSKLAEQRTKVIADALEKSGISRFRVQVLPGRSVPKGARAQAVFTPGAPATGLRPVAPSDDEVERFIVDAVNALPPATDGPVVEAQGPAKARGRGKPKRPVGAAPSRHPARKR